MVNAVDSLASGLAGLAPATGPRAPAPSAGETPDATAFDPHASSSGTAPPPPADAAPKITDGSVGDGFLAQALAQESGGSIASAPAPSARQAAAAYLATETQTDPKGAAEVLLPGVPPRLASGRAVDLSA